jgi:Cu+-exporting ATPase
MATSLAVGPGELGAVPAVDDGISPSATACFHCGAPFRGLVVQSDGRSFCCHGCRTVFELLSEHGLTDFYRFGTAAGVRVNAVVKQEEYKYLDDPVVRRRLVNFTLYLSSTTPRPK